MPPERTDERSGPEFAKRSVEPCGRLLLCGLGGLSLGLPRSQAVGGDSARRTRALARARRRGSRFLGGGDRPGAASQSGPTLPKCRGDESCFGHGLQDGILSSQIGGARPTFVERNSFRSPEKDTVAACPRGYGANSLNFYLGGDCKSRNAMVVYANSFNLQVVFCHPIPCILNPWELTSVVLLRMN